MKTFWLLVVCGLLVVAPPATVVFAQGAEETEEITLSLKEIGRLDIFEDRALSKADAVFNRGEYADAMAEYDAFLKKHADSYGAAYAMFRKGRCAELGGKQPEAIEAYAAVAKKYPKAVKYAVPALCRLGDCHTKAGAGEEAVKAWKQIGDNADYAKQPDAPAAMRKLVSALKKLNKAEEAAKYQKLIPATSVASTTTKPSAPSSAAGAAKTEPEPVDDTTKSTIRQHVRVEPDEAKLLAFYKTITPNAPADPAKTPEYWGWVMEGVMANGDFGWSERELRKTYYEKWIKLMEGKFPEADDFQIALARLHYGADRDRDKLAERLDAQFKKKKADTQRILTWVRAYKGNWTKTKEYAAMLDYETSGLEGIAKLIDILVNEQQESYLAKSTFKKVCEKIPFDKLSNDDIMKLITLSRETLEDSSTAKTLAEKLNLDKMSEKEKLELARKFLKLDPGMAEPIYAKLKDVDAGKMELFEFYLDGGESSKAIALADDLSKIEKYAKTMAQKKAQLLVAAKRYAEAITAFQELGNPPENLWRIVECHLAMNEPDKAVEQLRAIAAGHKAEAPKAVYRIAILYGDAVEEDPSNKAKQFAALREIVDKYPGTPEAKKAQKSIDDLGIPPANPEGITLGF